jgi:hypothetical protein
MTCFEFKPFAAALLSSLTLAGCGGGGAGDPPPTASNSLSKVATFAEESTSSADPTTVTSGNAVSPETDASLVAPTPVATAQSRGAKVGANISNVRYYSRGMEYVDLIRHAGGFGPVSGPWNTPATPIALDADGWPTEDFSVMLLGSQDPSAKGIAGRYTVVFRQTAQSRTRGDLRILIGGTSGTLSAISYDAATGLSHATMDLPVGTTDLWMTFTNTSGGLRDLKVIRPGYDWRSANLPVFTDLFLDHLKSLSTIRFMDWTATNSNFVARWDTRPTLVNTRANVNRQNGAQPGMPWERAIELANTANTDLWVCIPTKADSRYYTELAKLIKAKLKPNLNVYVEYSNEVWNGSFPQYHYMTGGAPSTFGSAVDEELAAGNVNLKHDETPTNVLSAYTLGTRIYTERLFRISEAFRGVFGDDQMITRVRPVLAWQVGTGSLFERMLDYAKRVYPNRPVNTAIYAISSAPYYALGANKTVEGLTATQVLDSLEASVNSLPLAYSYESSAFIAKKYGVKWVAYEGGADTFGPTSIAAKTEAHRSARMKTLCQKNIRDFHKAGGDLFMYYYAGAGSWSTQFGAWSMEEFLEPGKRSFKTQCVDEISNAAPEVATLRHVPGVAFDAAEQVSMYLAPTSANYPNARLYWQQDQQRDFLISSPTSACYRLSFTASFSPTATNVPRFDVLVNTQTALTSVPLARPATAGAFVNNEAGSVCLDAGVNIISLKMVSTGTVQVDKILVDTPTTGS